MSDVLAYDGQYFRVEIAEISKPDDSGKTEFVGWCSEPFKNLKDSPNQPLSRFVAGPPRATLAEARRHAFAWIKSSWDAEQAKRTVPARSTASVLYTVWLFKGERSLGIEFEEFSDAKMLAKLAEKSTDVSKVGITNNESPQYLTIWERPR